MRPTLRLTPTHVTHAPQERLEREYNLDLIVTAPSVVYEVTLNNGDKVRVDSPAKLVDSTERQEVQEPYVAMEMFCPKEYSGTLMELAQERRGEYKDMKFLTERRVSIKYDLPLAEVITDFFDQMKSRSKGYASMEYSVSGYRPNNLVRLDILINGENAPPLANIVHHDVAHSVGKALTRKLKELIPRQQFKVPIQAAIGLKIVASSAISPIRKDVLAKCYGGDISRKKKCAAACRLVAAPRYRPRDCPPLAWHHASHLSAPRDAAGCSTSRLRARSA